MKAISPCAKVVGHRRGATISAARRWGLSVADASARRWPGAPEATRLGVEFVSLDRLLAESDFVSLHAALTPETRGLIGATRLRQMKPSAYIINTARGAIMDEGALVRALEERWIAGAALDAFVVEPLPANMGVVPALEAFSRKTLAPLD